MVSLTALIIPAFVRIIRCPSPPKTLWSLRIREKILWTEMMSEKYYKVLFISLEMFLDKLKLGTVYDQQKSHTQICSINNYCKTVVLEKFEGEHEENLGKNNHFFRKKALINFLPSYQAALICVKIRFTLRPHISGKKRDNRFWRSYDEKNFYLILCLVTYSTFYNLFIVINYHTIVIY